MKQIFTNKKIIIAGIVTLIIVAFYIGTLVNPQDKLLESRIGNLYNQMETLKAENTQKLLELEAKKENEIVEQSARYGEQLQAKQIEIDQARKDCEEKQKTLDEIRKLMGMESLVNENNELKNQVEELKK